MEALIDHALLGRAAGLVAVGGLGAYPDPVVAEALEASRARAEADRRAAGDCASSYCGSGGDGGGGDGGGGGGCGGGCGGS